MKITIGIPCFNHQEYLADSIQSALDQTVPSEVIFVNDGSTDRSLDIAKGFPVAVVNQINKGLSSARNTVIMNATGDYILFLDSDDLLMDNCVERILQVAEQTNADIIAPSIKTFGVLNQETILDQQPTLEDFKTANRIPYCSAVKTSVLKEVGGYSPRMIWGYEDYALWIDLLKRGKTLVTIPEPLVLYRTKEDSMYTEARKHDIELWAQIIHDNPEVFNHAEN